MYLSKSFLVLAALAALAGCDTDGDPNSKTVYINVPAMTISGAFSLNGGSFPASQYEHGIISLADSNGNEAQLGKTYSVSYQTEVVAGNYRTQYRHVYGGAQVPVNRGNEIEAGFSLLEDQSLDINATAFQAQFTFTLNGAPFPVSEYDDALFYLQPQDGGERILLGNSYDGSGTVRVIPDTYTVVYEHVTGNQVPGNKHATILSGVVVSDTTALPINLEATQINPSFTLNGFPFPATLNEHALFVMQTTDMGNEVFLGRSFLSPTTLFALNGSYDVFYEYINGATIPVNDRARIRNLTLP